MASSASLQEPFTGLATPAGWTQTALGSATWSYTPYGAHVVFPATTSSSTDGDIVPPTLYDLTRSIFRINVLQVSGAGATHTDNVFRVRQNSTNYLTIFYEAGTLFFSKVVASAQTNIASIAYNATNHAWWQIRESGGVTFWETSADGQTWVTQTSQTNPITITSVDLLIGGLCFGVDTSPADFIFRYVNYPLAGTTTSVSSTSSTSSSISTTSSSTSSTSTSVSTTSASTSSTSSSISTSSTSSSISSTSSSTSSTSISSTSSSTSISSTSSSISSTSFSSTSTSSTSSSSSISSTSSSFSSTSSSISSTSMSTSSTSVSSTSSSSSTSTTTLPPNPNFSYQDSIANVPDFPYMIYLSSGNAKITSLAGLTTTPAILSFGAWFKPDLVQSSSFPHFISVGGSDSCVFYMDASTSSVHFKSAGMGGLDSGVLKFPAGVTSRSSLYHMAMTYDGATVTVYINGIVVYSIAQTGNVTLTSSAFLVVGDNSDGGNTMNGYFANAFVYNRGLSAAEITQMYLAGAQPSGSKIAYWAFNEGGGTTVTDASGSGNNGTITKGNYVRQTLVNPFANANYSQISGDDGDYFIEYGSRYLIEEYKYKHQNNTDAITFTWKGRSTVACSRSPLLIQIYNINSATWETLASNTTTPVDTDVTMKVTQSTNLSNYYDTTNIVTFRSYQQVI